MSATLPPLQIDCDFDSGNIQVLDASDPGHVHLAIRPDTHSGHYQWFHFRARGLTPGQRHQFSLDNAHGSSYGNAWDGYHALASYDQAHWFRVPSTFDGKALSFTLLAEHPEAWFAYFEPYPRARHNQLIERALKIDGVQLLANGRSVQGRDIPLLRASRGGGARRKLWLIAQQHPGEHMAEWFMEGVIDCLAAQGASVQRLLAAADLYLIPNMNPDGAFHGHLRTNFKGKDLNRAWQDASIELSPEVFFAQSQMKLHGVDAFIDVHGDEEIPHVFTAACEGNPGYTPRIAELETRFRSQLCALTRDFQTEHGYLRDQPGQANMTLACNAVGQAYDCLSLTLEMPFKDHDDNPDARTGWSGARSAALAGAVLETLERMVDELR
ncbi:carboxypeptidase family protein [Pseudomonas sp. S75]|uniref:M14 family metallopeptidase n=1 Tax=unclassified Pseudomonas TaxID=196821 RepID=UPI001904C148|nr:MULTISPECIES: M14-type cytosolic carboxypeptidase [unclassified Pseudomonas]MBJ9976410.1 carboxypeptidase family protein [Pseudomonas sp. S30]MBK0154478.1 carboxypeptidase family protein [Pseudomonas sp. S75]